MATQTKIELIDDLTGGEADETVQFGIDGKDFEIDLSLENAGELRDNMARYLAKARRIGKAKAISRSFASTRPRASREHLAAVRDWARSQGLQVSNRGRISAEVQQKFDAAHGAPVGSAHQSPVQ